MRSKYYSSEAIILARKNFSEADRIIILLTRNWGKLHILAKGVRKPISKKRGSLEIFNHIKFSASKGKSLDIMTEVDNIENFKKIRKNIKKAAVAYFLVEVTNRLLKEEIKSVEIFELLRSYLKKLEGSQPLRKLRYDFIHEILVILGFWPSFEEIKNPDGFLEEILESKLNSPIVGKKILS